ncbi:hypothetical protein FA95DRAFT_1459517, partial [Auriscalpium vulgare]
WTPDLQTRFGDDLCKVFISCGMAWNAANDAELRLFMAKWVPGAQVPDRQVLSGVTLNRAVERVEVKIKTKVQGKLGTGQCDGWKNIAKTSVVTSMMSVEHEAHLLRTHDMSGEPKTGDRLLELIRSDIDYTKEHFGVTTIAWCTDDGPDGKKARRLLSVVIPTIITLVCWAHQ